ncbi:tripartite tricarboxylate transporter substrate binding protein BugE [soil metagenome]
MNDRRRQLLLASAASLGAAPFASFAQSKFPDKNIRLIVPFAAGGTTDIVARIFADPFGHLIGQAVVVDNRGGGGGIVGAEAIKAASPDGYILGIATVSTMATNPAINPKITYNPLTDFVPITNLASTPNVLAVNPSFPAKNYAEFLKVVKASPGKYTFSSSGTGGIGHLMGEIYKDATGTFITHIPYRGAGPAINDTIGGQVSMIFDNLPSSLPFIQSGRLRAIAVASPKRIETLPDIPTFAELNLAAVNEGAWYGLQAPKGTPPDVIKFLQESAVKVLNMPDVKKRIEQTSSAVVANTPAQFAEQISAEFEKYKRIVKARNLTLET